jgi:hypothetical protein
MCRPGRCPGDHGCWCAPCEAGVYGDDERAAWIAERTANAPVTETERGIVPDLLAVVDAARPLVAVDPEADEVPDEDWGSEYLALREALRKLDAVR